MAPFRTVTAILFAAALAGGGPAAADDDVEKTAPDKPVQLYLDPFPVPPQHMDGEELDITVYLHVAEQDDLYELCKVTPRVRDAITTYLHARGVPAKAKGMVDTRRAGAILNRVIARSLNSDIVSLVTVAGEARTLEEGAVPGTQADNPRNCVSIGLRAKRLKAN